jgi:outer membrane receptor protein involved in Fe transport
MVLFLSLNRRTEKFNLFTQLGAGYRELPRDQENINRDLITNTEISSAGDEFRNENFYNFILGTDYYINPTNVITLSGSYAYEIEDQPSETSFTQRENNEITKEWIRSETTEANNPKLQYELQYKRDFTDHKDHKLLISAIGNFFGKDQSSVFENTVVSGIDDLSGQRTATEFQEGKYTFNLDYTKPFSDKWTLETGAQYLANNVSNDFEVSNEINGELIIDDGLTNVFEFNQNVLGVYTTGAYEASGWGLKLGLRIENTDVNTLLVNNNEENTQNFTDLFPSLHTSYKIKEGISVQGGYSRRIYRPRLWDLNPFFNIRNNFSIRAGNPNLQAEYTDSYEVGTIFILGQTSLNLNLYHRHTTDKIERVSIFQDNVNTFIPQNIGINNSTGLEINAKYSPNNKLTFTGDANYNVFSREGTFEDQVFDFSADQWSAKSTVKFKVNKSLDVELTGRHQSREQTVQGILSANTTADFGFRYKILNGKGVFNFSVRDIFASRIRENTIDQDNFFIYSRSLRGRFITLGFSYGFGKGEAMQFSGARRR